MRSYEHTHTADLSASLSCSAAVADRAPGQAAHGGHAFKPMDAEKAGDIPASFRDMMRRLLERREFNAIVAVANDLLADHPDSLYLHFALGTAHSNLEQNRQCIRHCRRFVEIQAQPHERSFKRANITGIQNNLALALKELGLPPQEHLADLEAELRPCVFVAAVSDAERGPALALASQLRRDGVRPVVLDYRGKSLKAQLKEASKSGAAYTVVLGSDEVAARTAVVRDMAAGEELTVPQDEIAARIQAGSSQPA